MNEAKEERFAIILMEFGANILARNEVCFASLTSDWTVTSYAYDCWVHDLSAVV